MDNSTDIRRRLIKNKMSRSVGGWPERSLNDIPFQIHDHHVLRFHHVVTDPAGLDDDETGGTVDRRGVAPREYYQATLNQVEISLLDFLFQLF